jgi:hypothetical protein
MPLYLGASANRIVSQFCLVRQPANAKRFPSHMAKTAARAGPCPTPSYCLWMYLGHTYSLPHRHLSYCSISDKFVLAL